MLEVRHVSPAALIARWRDSVFVLVIRTQLGVQDVAAAQPIAHDLIRECSNGIRILVVFEAAATRASDDVRTHEKRLVEDAGRSLRSLAVVFEGGQAQAAAIGAGVMDAISAADVPVRAKGHADVRAACEWLFAEDDLTAPATEALLLADAVANARRDGVAVRARR